MKVGALEQADSSVPGLFVVFLLYYPKIFCCFSIAIYSWIFVLACSLFHEFNLLSKLPDSLLCNFIAGVSRSTLFQGAIAESFFTIILVFDVMSNHLDSLFAE